MSKRKVVTMRTLHCLAIAALLTACAAPRGVPPVYATPNLDRVDGRLWRCGQPSALGLEFLRSQGVRTVIDLRDDGGWPGEREACERLGMVYTNIQMSGVSAPSKAQVWRVLQVVKSSPGAVIHCAHGCDRTGIVIACYRIDSGWSADAAMKEAQRYGLSPWLPAFKRFIERWP
jgi:protein tyrosine/serine phosphatase